MLARFEIRAAKKWAMGARLSRGCPWNPVGSKGRRSPYEGLPSWDDPSLVWRVSRPIPFENRRLWRTSAAGGSIPFMFRDARRTLIGGRERERAGQPGLLARTSCLAPPTGTTTCRYAPAAMTIGELTWERSGHVVSPTVPEEALLVLWRRSGNRSVGSAPEEVQLGCVFFL